MVRQAGPRLEANDVLCAAVDEVDHVARKEPTFAGYVTEGEIFLCFFGNIVNGRNLIEAFALGDGIGIRLAVPVEKTDRRLAGQGRQERA